MERLLRLAKKIEDVELRKKVEDFLKNLELTHPEFKKYPKTPLEEAKSPFTVVNVGTVERKVLEHTVALTEACIKVSEILERNFGVKLKRDYLIAAAILHDLMKCFEWTLACQPTGILLDHTMLAVAELYKRGFPEEVIHIVASHYGESGSTPPRTLEAFLLHYLDTTLSLMEFYIALFKGKQ